MDPQEDLELSPVKKSQGLVKAPVQTLKKKGDLPVLGEDSRRGKGS